MRRATPWIVIALVVGFAAGFAANVLASSGGSVRQAMAATVGAGDASVPGVVVQARRNGPILLPATLSVPSEKLQDWGPQPVPIEAPPLSMLRGQEMLRGAYGPIKAGIWECSPGRWVRQIMDAEFATFLEGEAVFTPDGGEPMTIRAGDTVWFPPHTTGTWDIKQKARKTYILIPGSDGAKAFAMLEKLWN